MRDCINNRVQIGPVLVGFKLDYHFKFNNQLLLKKNINNQLLVL